MFNLIPLERAMRSYLAIQDENNTELFISSDEQEYTPPINQVTK